MERKSLDQIASLAARGSTAGGVKYFLNAYFGTSDSDWTEVRNSDARLYLTIDQEVQTDRGLRTARIFLIEPMGDHGVTVDTRHLEGAKEVCLVGGQGCLVLYAGLKRACELRKLGSIEVIENLDVIAYGLTFGVLLAEVHSPQ